MKSFVYLSFFLMLSLHVIAQSKDSGSKTAIHAITQFQNDSTRTKQKGISNNSNSNVTKTVSQNGINRRDSTKAAITQNGSKDSTALAKDSILALQATIGERKKQEVKSWNLSVKTAILAANKDKHSFISMLFPGGLFNTSGNEQKDQAYISFHKEQDTDILFYTLLGIVLLLAIIKTGFGKYYHHFFHFFLRPNTRKKQSRESDTALNLIPAFLLNLLFTLTGGLYLSQILQQNNQMSLNWKLWLIAVLALIIVYSAKYISIKISGWLFNAPMQATTYNFVVFSINKIIGILLIPIIIFTAYGDEKMIVIIRTVAEIMLISLLLYRYIASFLLLRGKLNISVFHFILYICAVEILPLLILYKALLTQFHGNF